MSPNKKLDIVQFTFSPVILTFCLLYFLGVHDNPALYIFTLLGIVCFSIPFTLKKWKKEKES